MIIDTSIVPAVPVQQSTSPDRRWRAVLARDLRADGGFVYAVTSTGIYCRPSCPSRRPRRDRVRFFADADAAEGAGFRACRRCRPRDRQSPAVARVEKVRRWLDGHPDEPASLARLAALAGTSPWHLQRTFTRLIGVSPRDYAAAGRRARLKSALKRGASATEAVYDAGYGSASRVYEGNAPLGMTPGAYRRGGAAERITYAVVRTPIGLALIASTVRGVCLVAFGTRDVDLERALASEFPNAARQRDAQAMAREIAALSTHLEGGLTPVDLPLDVKGTVFQQRVWRALRQIPAGTTRTYAEVAAAIGRPTAARAVARACATNPVAVIVPCHRVVPQSGGTGGYRWGGEVKAKILGIERRAAK